MTEGKESMLNLSFVFDDANRALEKYSDHLCIASLPATVFMMQVDLINSYHHALDHYFTFLEIPNYAHLGPNGRRIVERSNGASSVGAGLDRFMAGRSHSTARRVWLDIHRYSERTNLGPSPEAGTAGIDRFKLAPKSSRHGRRRKAPRSPKSIFRWLGSRTESSG